MKMSFSQAQRVLKAARIVNDFVEPGPNVPESVAEAMFRRQERNEKVLDGLVMNILRGMVILDAYQVARDALIPGRR